MTFRKSANISLLILLTSLFACNKDEDPSNDFYIFVEQHSEVHGELISGPEPPLLQIDFPTYFFAVDSGILRGVIDFNIENGLKLIYGSGGCLTGTAGGGCATGLTGVYEIPYQKEDFELLKLDDKGNIVFTYKGEAHNLDAGKEWVLETTRMDTVDVEGQMSISKITETNRITNYGLLNKSDISVWVW